MTISNGLLRAATAADGPRLLCLWAALFEEDDSKTPEPWKAQASDWFARFVNVPGVARFPVIEADDEIVAAATRTVLT